MNKKVTRILPFTKFSQLLLPDIMVNGYFAKHKERNTWEAPGGHREDGEDILETAKRELYEETGAITFDITPICIYSVTAPDNFDGMETFGKLFFSDIHTFEKELHSEIEKNSNYG